MWQPKSVGVAGSDISSPDFETAADARFLVDARGRITRANAAASRMFSWPRELFESMDLGFFVAEFLADGDGGIRSIAGLIGANVDADRNARVIAKGLDGRKFRAELIFSGAKGSAERQRLAVFRELQWTPPKPL